jgi:hypothetical protein
MKNDAKLGMLAGVLGVIVAAVLFAQTPPPGAPARPDTAGEPKGNPGPPPVATATAPPAGEPARPAADAAPLASTPVPRTRKETEARPTSRGAGADEEP